MGAGRESRVVEREREWTVWRKKAEGTPAFWIAKEMGISERSVYRILKRMQVKVEAEFRQFLLAVKLEQTVKLRDLANLMLEECKRSARNRGTTKTIEGPRG